MPTATVLPRKKEASAIARMRFPSKRRTKNNSAKNQYKSLHRLMISALRD